MLHAGLTTLIVATLVGISSSDEMCASPTKVDLQGVIKEVIKLGDNSSDPTIVVTNFHILCRAFAEIEDQLRFVSVWVQYTCTGNTNCPLGSPPEQIESECKDGAWHHVLWNTPSYSRSQTTKASLSTSTREDCLFCVSPELLIIADQQDFLVVNITTHCITCDSICTSGEGLHRCFGHGSDSCCRYYNNSMCYNECPDPFTRVILEENQCTCPLGTTGYNCSEMVDCGELNLLANGNVDVPSTTYDSVATYTCDDGYTLMGNDKRTCQNSAMWTGSDPSCEIVVCQPLNPPLNGSVALTGLHFNAEATYSCDPGFAQIGSEKRICQSSGDWSGNAPTCSPIPCTDLPNLANGELHLDLPAKTVTYTCNTGYELMMGDAMRTCMLDGTWTGTHPMCTLVKCGGLNDPANGNVSVTDVVFDSVATYACHDDYNLTGDAMRMCLANASWSGSEPTCIFITIPTPNMTIPTNGEKRISLSLVVVVVTFLLSSILSMALI